MNTKSAIEYLKNSRHEGLIFDFDETLFFLAVDWPELKKKISDTLAHHNLSNNNKSLLETVYDLKTRNAEVYQTVSELILRYELEGLQKGIPNNNLITFLKKQTDRKVAIYSMNSSITLEKFLIDYGFTGQISTFYSRDTTHAPKPDGKPVNDIMQDWEMDKKKVVYIGNSWYDRVSAEMAGVESLIINWNPNRADL